MIDPSRLSRTQIVILIGFSVLVIALAAFAGNLARWILPTFGVIWAVLVLISAPQLVGVGVRPQSVLLMRGVALLVGIAALIRVMYLLRHAA